MKDLHSFFLIIHVTAGFTSLASGLAAMLSPKGKKYHLLSGKIYFRAMTATCSSALIMSLLKPNPFLYILAILSYFSVAAGYRSLYLKKIYTGELRPKVIDWTIALVPITLFILLYAVIFVYQIPQKGMEYINMGLSIYVSINCLVWLRSFYKPKKEKQYWLIQHFQGMGGAYIATTTAFLVTNFELFHPAFLWIAPSVIGGTTIGMVTYKMKKKFAAAKQFV